MTTSRSPPGDRKMDDLTGQIASEIGPKWVQLHSKLQLGHRDRYRFCVQHKDEPKPVQEANCTRDTIRLWQEGLGDVAEKEMMTQLLAALRKVMGFDERAQKLARSYGIFLNIPQPPSQDVTTSKNSLANGANTPQPTTSSPFTHHTDSPTTSSPLAPHHSSTVLNTNSTKASDEGGSEVDSTLPLDTYTQEQQNPKFRAPSPTLSSTSSTERSDDSHLLNSTIDISVMKHKYAILDVCQRLPPNVTVMNEFAESLNIPQDKVIQITNDFTMQEERYYQMLKFWLEEGRGSNKKTFMVLRDALVSCQQLTASDIVLRRLQSPGLTLR